jgi:hypothetical protein
LTVVSQLFAPRQTAEKPIVGAQVFSIKGVVNLGWSQKRPAFYVQKLA